MEALLVLPVILSIPLRLCAMDKHDLEDRYRGKFAVAMQDGLAFGVCEDSPDPLATSFFDMEDGVLTVNNSRSGGRRATSPLGAPDLIIAARCQIQNEPIHKGEVLAVDRVGSHFGHFYIRLYNIS